MYAQYLLFSALALIALWRLLTRPVGAVRALTYIGFATAMAYTHFFGVFTLAAHALIAGGWFVARRHAGHRVRRFWQLFLTLAAIAVLCAPIPLALLGSGRTFDSTDVTRRFVGLLEMTELMTSEFMVRLPLVASVWRYAYLVPVWALFLLGVGVLARYRARLTGLPIGVSHLPQGVMLLALAVAPMIAFLPASLAVPIFTPKYLSSVYPVLLAGLGIGIVAVARWHPPAGRIALAALMSLGAVGHYRDLTNVDVQREQWGYVADVLARHVEPGDKIVVFADYVQPVLEWSYHGPGEILKFEADPVHPEAFFDAIQQGSFRHLWLVLAHDHAAKIDHRLVEVASVRYPWWRAEYPNQGFIRVLEYALRWRYDALPRDANPANVAFANGVTLVGVTIEEQRVPATDQISHPPSHWVHVRAYWRRTGAIAPEHARPYLKLTSADGGEWGGDLPRIPSVFEFDPPTGWPTDGAGSIIATEHDVNLNPIAPPGAYAVIVGLVHDDGTKVPLSLHPDQFAARLGDVEIVGRK